jgi:hypothetical protein
MNRYATPSALRRALEDRLAALVEKEGGDIQRLRRQAAFDRLLCRLFPDKTSPWLLKGGYAMELRIRAARTNLNGKDHPVCLDQPRQPFWAF